MIRPIALGRKNWLFAGCETAGKRAAAIMSLLASAKANGHEPHAWLTDGLTRLPTTLDRDIDSLLPHRWKPTAQLKRRRCARCRAQTLTDNLTGVALISAGYTQNFP